MKSVSYKIVYKNNTSKENTINNLPECDLDAGSIKEHIAKQNGLSSDKFKIYAIDPMDSTKIPLSDGETLTESYKIVELYQEELSSEEKNSRPGEKSNSENSITFQETSQLIVQKSDNYQEIEPVSPPHVYGLFNVSRMIKCFSKQRFFQLNPDILVLNMYESRSKFPKRPQLTIPLLMITKISRLVKTPCFSSKSYMQIVTQNVSLMLSFEDKFVCKEWIKLVKEAIEYAKFVENKRNNLKDKWRPQQQINKVELIDEVKDIVTTEGVKKSYRSDPSEVLFSQQQKTVLFDHFEFKMKIGNGSFGLVYLASHKESSKVVAIKQLSKDRLIHRNQLRYAMTELKILCEVKHPFIVSLHYAFQTKENLYLAMQYCPNGNLSMIFVKQEQLIQDNQVLEIEDAVLYICEVILAIQYLHKKKIIYRDLKPQNILMAEDFHICLSDFGLSKTDVSANDYAESFLGTPAYLAPEMATNGKATQATDIYGIGAVMYEMVHGKMMYFGTSISDILNDIQQTEPQINPKLPKEIKSFLRCTLEKNPDKRIKNPKEHPLFKNINWNGISKKKIHPKVKKHQQRSSIQWDINNQQIDQDYDQQNYLQNRIEGWLYTRPM